MSQISPDGRHVVTTVNESVYTVTYATHKFLQVFYPTRGILAYWSAETGRIKALGGADDPDFVHCNPAWSPRGEWLVFARAKAKDPYILGEPLAAYPNDPAETPIQYDLYRMPFNGGAGGEPQPPT